MLFIKCSNCSFLEPLDGMSWFEAKGRCKEKGGKLVEIDSDEEERALVSYHGFSVSNFWIGLTDMRSEGDWRLASNGLEPSFLNWAEREPSNRTDNVDCAVFGVGINDAQTSIYSWFALDCQSKQLESSLWPMHALCELDHPVGNTSTESITTKGKSIKQWKIHEWQ